MPETSAMKRMLLWLTILLRQWELAEGSSMLDSDTSYILLIVLGGLFVTLKIMMSCNRDGRGRARDLSNVRDRMSERRRHRPSTVLEETSNGTPRNEQILYKFHFQTIVEDQENDVTAESIRSSCGVDNNSVDAEAVSDSSSPPPNNNSDTGSTSSSPSPATEEQQKQAKNNRPFHDFLSPASSFQHKNECCICLDHYGPGETVCVSKEKICDHVFHQECIEEWLQNHDDCPLCRADLMN